jgi:hypothetical protein
VPRCCRALEFIIRQQLHLLSRSVFNDLVLRELAHYKFIKTAETTASGRMGRGVAAADGGDELERRLEEVGQKAHRTIDPKIRGSIPSEIPLFVTWRNKSLFLKWMAG